MDLQSLIKRKKNVTGVEPGEEQVDGAKKTSKQVSYTFAYYLSYTCAKEDVPVSWEAVQGAMFPPANPLSRVVAGLQFNILFAYLTKVTAAALILWIISHYFHLFFCAEGFGFKREEEEDCDCAFQHICHVHFCLFQHILYLLLI